MLWKDGNYKPGGWKYFHPNNRITELTERTVRDDLSWRNSPGHRQFIVSRDLWDVVAIVAVFGCWQVFLHALDVPPATDHSPFLPVPLPGQKITGHECPPNNLRTSAHSGPERHPSLSKSASVLSYGSHPKASSPALLRISFICDVVISLFRSENTTFLFSEGKSASWSVSPFEAEVESISSGHLVAQPGPWGADVITELEMSSVMVLEALP